MLSTLIKNLTPKNFIVVLTTLLFFSCQKDLSLEDGGSLQPPPDLSTKVSSSVSGFVTDENDAAVKNATVQFGTSNITTDKYGYFEAKNVQVVKEAAVVTVSKPGYFKGIKTYIAKEGKAAFFRIKLIPKTIAGNVNAASGGTVTLANGLSIKLNAGTIVNATTNAQYTGTVNVAAYWINPTANDLPNIMPGDLRGINTAGAMKLLQTFGMAAVELTGASGELLQIVNGQKATLTMPIPSSLSATAPASIPLWYFDEAKGLWKEEGSAVKTGNTYVGNVGHFSFWNCDVPGNYVQFNCTIKDAAGNPLSFVFAKISVVGTNNVAWGFTDASGYVAGPVPNNSQLVLELFSSYFCSTPSYTQAFTTTTSNVSLGVITLPANLTATASGTVTDCSNNAVSNGSIILAHGSLTTRYAVSNTGTFSFSTLLCGNNIPVTVIAQDITAAQTSNPIPYTLVYGSNNIGNIVACGTQIPEYVNFSINGTNYYLSTPTDFINNIGYSSTYSFVFAGGSGNNSMGFGFTHLNSQPNNVGNLTDFLCNKVNDSMNITTPIAVNITEFENVGGHISGNFSGIMTGYNNPSVNYNVVCYFRIRRDY